MSESKLRTLLRNSLYPFGVLSECELPEVPDYSKLVE